MFADHYSIHCTCERHYFPLCLEFSVNSSLEVFRPGILTPYLHSDLLRQMYSSGSNSPRQMTLLPLHVPRSNQ